LLIVLLSQLQDLCGTLLGKGRRLFELVNGRLSPPALERIFFRRSSTGRGLGSSLASRMGLLLLM
jgi:hypothetical protein